MKYAHANGPKLNLRSTLWGYASLLQAGQMSIVVAKLAHDLLFAYSLLNWKYEIGIRTEKEVSHLIKEALEKRYNVRFVEYDYFPMDVLINDYLRIDAFAPNDEWTVVDVGATCGDYSIVMAKSFGAKKVISVEPSDLAYSKLLKNVALNNLNSVVIPYKVALWDKNEETSSKNRSVREIILWDRQDRHTVTNSARYEGLMCRTLDSIVGELGIERLDLLKIDVEGSELKVLNGAECTLRKFKPRVVIETHSELLRAEVYRLLLLQNYHLVYEKRQVFGRSSVLYFIESK